MFTAGIHIIIDSRPTNRSIKAKCLCVSICNCSCGTLFNLLVQIKFHILKGGLVRIISNLVNGNFEGIDNSLVLHSLRCIRSCATILLNIIGIVKFYRVGVAIRGGDRSLIQYGSISNRQCFALVCSYRARNKLNSKATRSNRLHGIDTIACIFNHIIVILNLNRIHIVRQIFRSIGHGKGL